MDIRAKTARNTDIEAAPEHAALMITTSFSPESVTMEMDESLPVMVMKFRVILYTIHVVACAYFTPAKVSTSLGKAIVNP